MNPPIVSSPKTLSPLPPVLHNGLIAVSVFGLLSFITSIGLFLRLAYRLFEWKRKTQVRVNQFIILLLNLVLADIQQSVAFLLNIQWLRTNSITTGTATCFAQGWFVSTGDLASGVFTLAIAVHSFTDIVFDVRPSRRALLLTIAALWAFVYALAIAGVALHPRDFYTRAGAWCWINAAYSPERLWLHYLWVIIAEFGTVLLYSALVAILHHRVRSAYYTTDAQLRARAAAKLIVAYPVVYVVCTLPLVTARLMGMAGGRSSRGVTFLELCIAGAMITSNGWLDVLLYSVTRRAALFGPQMSDEHENMLSTFRIRPDQAYGTTTTIEAVGPGAVGPRAAARKRSTMMGLVGRYGSREELVGEDGVPPLPPPPSRGVKAERVVRVTEEVIELEMTGQFHRSSDAGQSKEETASLSHKSDR